MPSKRKNVFTKAADAEFGGSSDFDKVVAPRASSRQTVSFRMDRAKYKILKRTALEDDRSCESLLTEAVDLILAKYGTAPVA
ncbi:MAG: hypothetical protein P4L98_20730 [Ancalomicrobiaceae bacterium]|nr:hypothetical protein [Ancalomicrobiaceae bacterium]